MFSPIHRALGVPAGPLDEALLTKAIDNRVEEAHDLDWKHDFYASLGSDEKQREAAKDIAAMANSGGGLIVFGVTEKNNAAEALSPLKTWKTSNEQWIHQLAFNQVHPPVTGIEFSKIYVTDGSIVAMRIPDSPDAPHIVTPRKNPVPFSFYVPIRTGSDTQFMTERGLALAYTQRFNRRRIWDEDFDRLFSDTIDSLPNASGVATAIGVARPRQPRTSALRLTQHDASKVREVALNERSTDGPTVGIPWGGPHFIPGLRRWVIEASSQSGNPFRTKAALHFDGSVSVTAKIGGIDLSDDPDSNKDSDVSSPFIERFVTDLVALAAAHAQQLGIMGTYGLRTSIVGADGLLSIRGHDPRIPASLAAAVPPMRRLIPVDYELLDLSDRSQLNAAAHTISLDIVNQAGISELSLLLGRES